MIHLKPDGPLSYSDGEVLFNWCLAGCGIYAVFPRRKHLPLRERLWVDYPKAQDALPGFCLSHG